MYLLRYAMFSACKTHQRFGWLQAQHPSLCPSWCSPARGPGPGWGPAPRPPALPSCSSPSQQAGFATSRLDAELGAISGLSPVTGCLKL